MQWVKEVLKVSIATNWLGNFIALVTIITYTVVSLYSTTEGGAVTTAKVFTVISTIKIISEPLLMFGQRLGAMVTAWASFKRIEDFLLCDERAAAQLTDGEATTGSTTANCHIVLRHASFGVKDKAVLLEGLDVELVDPALWMIVGRVGSVRLVQEHDLG